MKSHTTAFARIVSNTAASAAYRRITRGNVTQRFLFGVAALVILLGGGALWRATRQAAPSASVIATNRHTHRPEYVATLPWQIQAQVSGQAPSQASVAAAHSQGLRPEYVMTLPWQVQDQLRSPSVSAASVAATDRHVPRPEYVVTLPWQIQAQVQGLPQARAAGPTLAHPDALGPEDIVALPPQIQDQVRRSLRADSK
jgi:hypothetical protein